MKTANERGVPMAIGPIISNGKNRQLTVFGSMQIVLGVISISANAITMNIFRTFSLPGLPYVGYGFWNGTIFILTGMLGVVSGLQRGRFTTIFFGLMSILSACLTVALFTLAIISAGLCGISGYWVYDYTGGGGYSSRYAYASSEHPDAQKVAIAMEMIMAVVAIVEAFVAIRSALAVRKTGISCRDGCGQPDRTSSQPILGHCLPSYPSSDQLSSTDSEQFHVEGLLSLRDESNEKQSSTMDVKHPLPVGETRANKLKTANESGVPMANGPIISDGNNRQLTILGSAQIVLGVISIIAHAINMVIFGSFYLPGLPQVGYGFWNGTIFILTGMLGVVSGLQRYRFTTILFGLMSILSACLTVALFTLAIASATLRCIMPQGHWVYDNTRGGDMHYEYGISEHPDAQRVAIAMEMVMAVVAIGEAFVAIRSALAVRKTGISCRDGCCQPDRTSSQPILPSYPSSSYPSSDQIKMKTANECGVPMANGPIISDGKSRQLTILGSAQIVLGVISIIAYAINVVICRSHDLPGLPRAGHGFWSGTTFILTGILGVVSGLQRGRFTTILFGLMSILSACLTVALFTLAIVSAGLCSIRPKGRFIDDNTNGGSQQYVEGISEHPDVEKAVIAIQMIMAVVAVLEAFVAIRSALAVRKTGISFRDGCGQPDETSSQPFLKFEVGYCFCHCLGSCHLPSYPNSDQLSSADPEQSLVEGLLSLRDEDNEKHSAMMDVKHPLLFYSGPFDQKQQIGPLDQNQIDEDSSDRSKLIEK